MKAFCTTFIIALFVPCLTESTRLQTKMVSIKFGPSPRRTKSRAKTLSSKKSSGKTSHMSISSFSQLSKSKSSSSSQLSNRSLSNDHSTITMDVTSIPSGYVYTVPLTPPPSLSPTSHRFKPNIQDANIFPEKDDSSMILSSADTVASKRIAKAKDMFVDYHFQLFDITSAMNSTIISLFEQVAKDFIVESINSIDSVHFNVKSVTVTGQRLHLQNRQTTSLNPPTKQSFLLVNMTISTEVVSHSENPESFYTDLLLRGFQNKTELFLNNLRATSIFFANWQRDKFSDNSFDIASIEVADEDYENNSTSWSLILKVLIPTLFVACVAALVVLLTIKRRSYYNMSEGPDAGFKIKTEQKIGELSTKPSFKRRVLSLDEETMIKAMTIENGSALVELEKMDDNDRLEVDLEALKVDIDDEIIYVEHAIEILHRREKPI